MTAKVKISIAAILVIGTLFTMWQFYWLNGKDPDPGRPLDGGMPAHASAGTGMDAHANEPSIQGTGEDPSMLRERIEPHDSLSGFEKKFVSILALEEGTETPIQVVLATLHEEKKGRINAVSEVLTGADGRCKLSINGLEDAGYLYVTAFKPGYTTEFEYVDWDEDGWIEDEIEFRLADGTPLPVKVLEASGKKPVKGALIHFYQDDVDYSTLVTEETDYEWCFKTDEEGCCLIPAVKEDRPFNLRVYHPDYAQVCRYNQFCKPGVVMLVLLGAGGCIEGTVYTTRGFHSKAQVYEFPNPKTMITPVSRTRERTAVSA